MAFSLISNNGIRYTWSIDDVKPFIGYHIPANVVYLQADGDELELIKKRFVNVPHCHQITIWRGDMAQFIFDNL